MFNYNATDLPLSLSQAQKDALKQYTADFKDLMERKKPVLLDFSMGLQTQLSEVLATQNAWKNLLNKTALRQHLMVHLLHNDNDVLALPWHIATPENPYIHLSKGFDTEGSAEVPMFTPEKV